MLGVLFVSIHVLRVEDDRPWQMPGRCWHRFQSASSVWRTTSTGGQPASPAAISIHVLRVEDDAKPPVLCWLLSNFNPRPPCGGRRDRTNFAPKAKTFQSTSSVWRTTLRIGHSGDSRLISIHVLRVEDDSALRCRCACRCYFNPRPPCGGRLRYYLFVADYI